MRCSVAADFRSSSSTQNRGLLPSLYSDMTAFRYLPVQHHMHSLPQPLRHSDNEHLLSECHRRLFAFVSPFCSLPSVVPQIKGFKIARDKAIVGHRGVVLPFKSKIWQPFFSGSSLCVTEGRKGTVKYKKPPYRANHGLQSPGNAFIRLCQTKWVLVLRVRISYRALLASYIGRLALVLRIIGPINRGEPASPCRPQSRSHAHLQHTRARMHSWASVPRTCRDSNRFCSSLAHGK